MDRGDVLDLFDVLPRRVQRRIVAAVAVVVMLAGLVAPDLRLREQVVRWVVEGYAEQVSEPLEDMLSGLVPRPMPTFAPPNGR